MRLCRLSAVFVVLALSSILSAELHAAPPNLVFILVDDLGQRDLGCYGSTFYETPHVDRLAREGMRFTDAYAACSVCSPTRASIMIGKYPQRVGLTDYINPGGANQPQNWKRNTLLLPAAYADRLPLEEITLAEALKAHGYATFFGGKWHLGPEGYYPEDQGFDINRGGIEHGGPYGGKKYFSPYGNPRLEDGPPGEHLPDRLAGEAARFIAEHAQQPFLVYLSFYSVHTPLMARDDLRQKYRAKAAALDPNSPRFGDEPPRKVRLVQDHAVYGGMVEAMDLAVGKVLAALDEHDLAENTIVIFTSDNGGLSTSEGSPTSNLPLRAGKGWLYEGGIREPLLVRWPARVAAGSVRSTPVISVDYYPTLLAAAGVPLPEGHRVDGVNLLPVLTGSGHLAERALFWHYPHYGNQGGAPGAALRQGDWKLIEWFERGNLELFNLREDPGEQLNLAAHEPHRVRAMLTTLRTWQQEVGAAQPTKNPDYDPTKPDGRAGKN